MAFEKVFAFIVAVACRKRTEEISIGGIFCVGTVLWDALVLELLEFFTLVL
jgi:hypothetical protein